MKKLIISFSILTLLGAGCAASPPTESSLTGKLVNKCEPGEVEIEGYGDPGERLENCFVKYPGEPSRQDKSYYVVEDICGQFTPEFMENMMGRKIVSIQKPQHWSLYNCTYYFDQNKYIMLNLEYLDPENQKKGHELVGRSIKTDPEIDMEHFIVWQEDGEINEIYLILGPRKFISLNRSSTSALNNQDMINLAVSLSKVIKNFE